MIDSLRLNLPGAVFPTVKAWPSDFNFGALFRDSQEVNNFFEKQLNENQWTIVKSHLLPTESRLVAESKKVSFQTRKLIRKVWNQSIKIYMYRDVRDVLISYYHLCNPRMGFSTFIWNPNMLDKFQMRRAEEYDENKVLFWKEHVEQWLDVSEVYPVKYEDLRDRFDEVIRCLLQTQFDLEFVKPLCKPKKDNNASLWAKCKNILRKTGSSRIPVDSTNYVGIPRRGGWNKYYNEADRTMISEIVGNFLLKLGYDIKKWE